MKEEQPQNSAEVNFHSVEDENSQDEFVTPALEAEIPNPSQSNEKDKEHAEKIEEVRKDLNEVKQESKNGAKEVVGNRLFNIAQFLQMFDVDQGDLSQEIEWIENTVRSGEKAIDSLEEQGDRVLAKKLGKIYAQLELFRDVLQKNKYIEKKGLFFKEISNRETVHELFKALSDRVSDSIEELGTKNPMKNSLRYLEKERL